MNSTPHRTRARVSQEHSDRLDGEALDDSIVDGLISVTSMRRRGSLSGPPGEQHAVFGHSRAALLRTGLIANCWGGDQVFLAELVLKGTFNELPERISPAVHLSRRWPNRPLRRWPSLVATRRRGRRALPRTRLTFELLRPARSRYHCGREQR